MDEWEIEIAGDKVGVVRVEARYLNPNEVNKASFIVSLRSARASK